MDDYLSSYVDQVLDSQEYQSGIFRKGTFFQRLMRRFSKE
jgi:hypothetical protein